MKSSAVLASLLFGSFAVAAPFDKRALAYKTEIVTETVVVFTTVWEDDAVAQATTTPAGYFYEQPQQPSSAAAKPTPSAAPAPAPVPEKKTSSVAPPQAPTPTPAPSPAPVPEQPKPVEQPKPSSPAYVAPAPAPSSAAPAPAPAATSAAPAPAPVSNPPSTGSSGGDEYTNVDITIYDNSGGYGACGTKLYDTDMVVAIAKEAWGESTYDVMTGQATNKWCGQRIKVNYQGNSIEAVIQDMCPKCVGHDIDLSLNAWKQLTGKDEKTRLKASWSKMN